MSNDKKTLADVKPGGRVRLWDRLAIESRARELLAHEYAMSGSTKRADKIIAGFDCAPATEYAVRAIVAALSAQPSPGGQDALTAQQIYDRFGFLEGLVTEATYRRISEEATRIQQQALITRQPVKAVNADEAPFGLTTTEKAAWARGANDAIKEYATRQPVGPKFYTEDGPCWWHGGKAFIVTVDGDRLQLSVMDGPRCEFIGDARPFRVPARQPVGEPVAFMVRWKPEGGFGLEWPKNMQYFRDRADEYEIVPLHREAPPAQAVDLRQFRDAVLCWRREQLSRTTYVPDAESSPGDNVERADRLLALIDKAVQP